MLAVGPCGKPRKLRKQMYKCADQDEERQQALQLLPAPWHTRTVHFNAAHL